MEEWQIEIISRNLTKLVELTDCNTGLLTRLESCGILGRDDIEKLNRTGLTSLKQARAFYSIIKTRKNSFEAFLKALNDTNQTGALGVLKQELSLDDTQISYDENSVLGKGSSGTAVYKGKFGNRDVAVKKVHCNDMFRGALHEVKLLRDCDGHENVVRYVGTKQAGDFILIALELCDVTLRKWVEEQASDIPQGEVLRQVTTGLEWLHSKNIVHRDIKPENILLKLEQQLKRVKLSDFGLSRRIVDGKSFVSTKNAGGTSGWMAPEILEHVDQGNKTKCKFTYASDVFSLGCVYYYVLTDGKFAFGGKIRCQTNILEGKPMTKASQMKHACTQNLLFIKLMIAKDPKSRPNCSDLLKIPLFWSSNDRVRFLDDIKVRGGVLEEVLRFKTQDPCNFDHREELSVLKRIGCPENVGIKCVTPFAYLRYKGYELHSMINLNTFVLQNSNSKESESKLDGVKFIPATDAATPQYNQLQSQTECSLVSDGTNAVPKSDGSNASSIFRKLFSELFKPTQSKVDRILNNLKEKKTGLMELIKKEDLNTIKGVLEKHKDMNDDEKEELLVFAVVRREYELVEYLINKQGFGSLLTKPVFKDSLIHECIEDIHLIDAERFKEKCRILELLFTKNPLLIESKTSGDYQYTPLFVATIRKFKNGKQLEFIQFLLSHNADVNGRCYDIEEKYNNRTPLHEAVFNHGDNQLELIRLLIDHKADVNARGFENQTPLHFAVKQKPPPPNMMEIIKLLIESGADPDAVDKNGRTFLHRAPQFLSPELYAQLIEYFDSTSRTKSLKMADNEKQTHLHCAVRWLEPLKSTLEIFKKRGLDFNALDKYGNSVLFYAIEGGRSASFLNQLNSYGADWTILNKNKTNPLNYAAYRSNLDALKMFLSLGYDVNASNLQGRTPLHRALTGKKFNKDIMTDHEVVKLLLENGADVNVKDNQGNIPFDLAKERAKIGFAEEYTLHLLNSFVSKK